MWMCLREFHTLDLGLTNKILIRPFTFPWESPVAHRLANNSK